MHLRLLKNNWSRRLNYQEDIIFEKSMPIAKIRGNNHLDKKNLRADSPVTKQFCHLLVFLVESWQTIR